MVVNSENIGMLMDYATGHDVNGHNMTKGHYDLGKTPSSAIEFRRLFPDSIIRFIK